MLFQENIMFTEEKYDEYEVKKNTVEKIKTIYDFFTLSSLFWNE